MLFRSPDARHDLGVRQRSGDIARGSGDETDQTAWWLAADAIVEHEAPPGEAHGLSDDGAGLRAERRRDGAVTGGP